MYLTRVVGWKRKKFVTYGGQFQSWNPPHTRQTDKLSSSLFHSQCFIGKGYN